MLGGRIKSVRISNNLNQVQFAKILNVTKQSVSNWEHNNIQPSVDIIRDISTKFNVSTDYLLELNDRLTLYVDDLPIEVIMHLQQIINDLKNSYNNER